jgi:NADH-ubiquinone oxidoreductase chain 6
MILTIFIVIIASTAFTLPLASNPLRLGLLILLTALILSISFAISMSSWVAFLIFLIYVSGILIIFSYFVSIIPNQNISNTIIKILLILTLITLTLATIFLNAPIFQIHYSQINIFYNYQNSRILITLALILIYTIVIVVKISTYKKGALRSFIKYV